VGGRGHQNSYIDTVVILPFFWNNGMRNWTDRESEKEKDRVEMDGRRKEVKVSKIIFKKEDSSER
jgi:hypothetical protein